MPSLAALQQPLLVVAPQAQCATQTSFSVREGGEGFTVSRQEDGTVWFTAPHGGPIKDAHGQTVASMRYNGRVADVSSQTAQFQVRFVFFWALWSA